MDTTPPLTHEPFPAARFIKEIGRGVKGARSMTRDDAFALYKAMLDGRVSDLELGGILLAMRIKGESVDEIAGFMDAAASSFAPLPAPPGDFAPVLIPSYNGSRKLANLTPLLALLLAREGVPVLVHGVSQDPGRVTTAEIFAAMGIGPTGSTAEMLDAFAAHKPVFMPIERLAPELAHQLSLRRILGVRNSTHTVVKMLQPFEGPALRLVSYTHPEYLAMLTAYFGGVAPAARGDVFLMRGTEGETVANANRAQQIEWFHAGVQSVRVERAAPADELAPAPEGRDAAATAAWIARALNGEQPVPAPIAAQAAHCVQVARTLRVE
jgi:anthranilate phosphoribosyltransferase